MEFKLLVGYYFLLFISTIIVIYHSIFKPCSNKNDMGLIVYLSLSTVFSVFKLLKFNLFRIESLNSSYEVLIIPLVIIARLFKWHFFVFINIVFIAFVIFNVSFTLYYFVHVFFLILFLFQHLFYQKKINYLIHNLFLISVFVFTFLFDLFFEYQQFWITSHYKYNVFIFYSFFLYIFYIFIIFKYAKS